MARMREEIDPETGLVLLIDTKYAPGQARDDHGRFGFGPNEDHAHGEHIHAHELAPRLHAHIGANLTAQNIRGGLRHPDWRKPALSVGEKPLPIPKTFSDLRAHLAEHHGGVSQFTRYGSRDELRDMTMRHDVEHGYRTRVGPPSAFKVTHVH